MERLQLIKLFLNLGIQLDEKALSYLLENPVLVDKILKTHVDQLPPILTYDHIEEFKGGKNNLRILKSYESKKEETVFNIIDLLKRRYNFLKDSLLSRVEEFNLVSIKKINEKIKQFSVIGIVLENNEKIILEDTTGLDEFLIDNELGKFIVEDEVIGVVCERKDGLNYVKQVVYPDIPFKKTVNYSKSNRRCIFISDVHMDSSSFKKNAYENFLNWLKNEKETLVIVLGGISKNKKDIDNFLNDISKNQTIVLSQDENFKNNLNDPTLIELENVKIFLSEGKFIENYSNKWKLPPDETLVNLLKKRHLNPIFSKPFDNDAFLLEDIPDIIAVGHTLKPTMVNYKGTTILTSGSFTTEPAYWLVDLRTRETFKIEFS